MLRASRMFPGRVLLGVNLGKVGFMSGMRPEDLDSGVQKVLDGALHVQEYRMLEVRMEGEDEVRTAVNDAVLLKETPHQIASVDVAINGEDLVSYQCAADRGYTAWLDRLRSLAGGPDLRRCCLLCTRSIAPHSGESPVGAGEDQSSSSGSRNATPCSRWTRRPRADTRRRTSVGGALARKR